MLPTSTHTRSRRERKGPSGRTQEIQRLIGRSMRAALNLEKLGERTVTLDCDVITSYSIHYTKLYEMKYIPKPESPCLKITSPGIKLLLCKKLHKILSSDSSKFSRTLILRK